MTMMRQNSFQNEKQVEEFHPKEDDDNNLNEVRDETQDEGKLRKIYSKFKRYTSIIESQNKSDEEISAIYQQTLQKNYVDLSSDLDSSVAIHILMKEEKSKIEQTFIRNAIQGMKLFEKHRDLLHTQGFGNHLFSQMKVELHEKQEVLFHYGDYGVKYYIVLKGKFLLQKVLLNLITNENLGKLDLLVPKSDCIEENQQLASKSMPTIPYFDPSRNIEKVLENETFDEYIERVYPRMQFVKTFVPGEAFGEIALITNQQRQKSFVYRRNVYDILIRTGSFIVREDAYLLVITKQAFEEILGKFHDFMQVRNLNFLNQFSFLQHIPKSKLLSLIQFMKILSFKRNNVIYMENQKCAGIYFIQEGEVSISSVLTDVSPPIDVLQHLKVSYKKQKLTTKVIIKATNSFFGEEEIILGMSLRTSKAVCHSEKCELILLPYEVIEKRSQMKLK